MPWKGEEVEGAWRLLVLALPLEPVEVLQRCELRSRKGLLRRIAKPVLVRGGTFAGNSDSERAVRRRTLQIIQIARRIPGAIALLPTHGHEATASACVASRLARGDCLLPARRFRFGQPPRSCVVSAAVGSLICLTTGPLDGTQAVPGGLGFGFPLCESLGFRVSGFWPSSPTWGR
eukprot:scaffold40250_cov80-Phaeocystis_antarctica.AAC.1